MHLVARKPVLVVVLTAMAVVVVFLGWTRGVDWWHARQDRPAYGSPHFPRTLHAAPESVPTVADWGPVGPVAVVYAAERVVRGLGDEVHHPWVAVSALDGEYRALAHPSLPAAARGAAVAVAPDGRRLAWASDSRVVLYDPVADRTRAVPLDGPAVVGGFSPDGSRLLVHDGRLHALAVDSGGTTPVDAPGDVPATSATRAAWTPDGSAVTFVADRRLVTARVGHGDPVSRPTTLPPTATLVWRPDGEELVTLDSSGGRLQAWPATGDGGVAARPRTLRPRIYSDLLLGFTDEEHLAVVGLVLGTGTLPYLFDVPVDGGRARQVGTLPEVGNWAGPQTLAYAADALAAGPADRPRPPQAWSDRAKLTTTVLAGFFLAGMYLTRRARRRRRRRLRRT